MAPDIFDRWTRAAGLVAVAALVWAVVAPDGVFWNAVLAAGLVGAAVTTAVPVRRRSDPNLVQVIATAEAEPVVVPAPAGHRGGAGFTRAREES